MTSLDPHPHRRYVLRFGAENAMQPRLEVRNARFELVGNCAAHDLEGLYRLLGNPQKTTELQAFIAAMPIGRITIFEI